MDKHQAKAPCAWLFNSNSDDMRAILQFSLHRALQYDAVHVDIASPASLTLACWGNIRAQLFV